MFFETIAKFDTFQFICGTPNKYIPPNFHLRPPSIVKSETIVRSSFGPLRTAAHAPLLVVCTMGNNPTQKRQVG